MGWSSTWIGVGGGFGASALVGASYYSMVLHNMESNQTNINAAVFGRRLGLTLQAEGATAICLMTGVPDGSRFNRMESSGVDWGLGAGFNISATVRNGGVALNTLVDSAASVASRVSQSSLGSWATQEPVKNLVRGIMGDITANSNAQNFVVLPTPASLSIGGGLWYEWSDVLKMGHNLMWDREPPNWGLESRAGSVVLRMQGIPLSNGSIIRVGLPVDMFGSDDSLVWDDNGRRTARLIGMVFDGKLFPAGTTAARSLGPDGITLSNLNFTGHNEVNIFSVGRNSDVATNDTMSIGVSITTGSIEHWASSDYCEVRTNSRGQIYQRIGHGGWRS